VGVSGAELSGIRGRIATQRNSVWETGSPAKRLAWAVGGTILVLLAVGWRASNGLEGGDWIFVASAPFLLAFFIWQGTRATRDRDLP
jgi:hypothetical protein